MNSDGGRVVRSEGAITLQSATLRCRRYVWLLSLQLRNPLKPRSCRVHATMKKPERRHDGESAHHTVHALQSRNTKGERVGELCNPVKLKATRPCRKDSHSYDDGNDRVRVPADARMVLLARVGYATQRQRRAATARARVGRSHPPTLRSYVSWCTYDLSWRVSPRWR